MDSINAFLLGQKNREKELMVFDWYKAVNLINEHKALNASAGLRGDWEWTGGDILVDGKPPEDNDTYLASTWAKPELEIDGIIYECYKMESETPNWNSGTFWPESCLKLLHTINQEFINTGGS